MRLYYLRGFENLMMDYAAEEPELQALIDLVAGFNRRIVDRFMQHGIDVLEAGDDLGTQTASMISPADFRKWITPAYKQIFAPVRAAGAQVSLHSDGHMVELIDELIDAGVTICNPQDLCNGIDEIKAAVDGRICIRLDIDRQTIVPFGTPKEIHDLIEEGVRKLGSPKGGLELVVRPLSPHPAGEHRGRLQRLRGVPNVLVRWARQSLSRSRSTLSVWKGAGAPPMIGKLICHRQGSRLIPLK